MRRLQDEALLWLVTLVALVAFAAGAVWHSTVGRRVYVVPQVTPATAAPAVPFEETP